MVQLTKSFSRFFSRFVPAPLIGGAGIAGISHSFLFKDISGIAGKLECHNLLSVDLNT